MLRFAERCHPAVCQLDGSFCWISETVWPSNTEGLCQSKERRQTQHSDTHRLYDHVGEYRLVLICLIKVKDNRNDRMPGLFNDSCHFPFMFLTWSSLSVLPSCTAGDIKFDHNTEQNHQECEEEIQNSTNKKILLL